MSTPTLHVKSPVNLGYQVLSLVADPVYRLARKVTRRIGFRYEYLYWHLRRNPARNILEIGVYRGVRSREFVKACLANLPAREVNFYGIDLFELYKELDSEFITKEFAQTKPPLSRDEIREVLGALLPQSNIHLFAGRSDRILARHSQDMPQMDFIFIDGGHSLETIQSDFEYCSKLISPAGTIFLDDYWLSRDAGCRVLFERLPPHLWEKWLFPIPDFYKDTVGFIWLARVRGRQAVTRGEHK